MDDIRRLWLRRVRAFCFSLLSPTRRLVGREKDLDPTNRAHVGNTLRKWSRRYLAIDLVLAAVLLAASVIWPYERNWPWLLVCLALAYSWSRVNEVFWAFYRDAQDRLQERDPSSDLHAHERITFAIRSYVALLVNYAVIYYLVPIPDGFGPGRLVTYFDSVYFSGVTLATLGYGDIAPKAWLFRLAALYEVFTGILLVVLSVAAYVNAQSRETK